MTTFQLGLIGGGTITKAHIGAAEASAGRIRIAAVVDPAEPARRAVSEATGAEAFASSDELFNSKTRLDGLLVCTPPSVRIPIVKTALERGMPVMVEKPLAHNATDAAALLDLATKYSNVATAVGYCHRFVPAVLEMKRQINSGELGEFVRFENTFASWFPAMQQRWMSDPLVSGGGSFIDTGCHSLDLFQFLVGPGKAAGAVLRRGWPGRGESNATVIMSADKGAGVINSGWAEPVRFVLTVVGTKSMLTYDYEKPTELHFKPSQGTPGVIPVPSHETRFDKQLLAFAQVAFRSGDRANLASFSDGYAVAKMVDDVQRIAILI